MKYISINDLSDTIRKNIWKIPNDIDFIIGVPRSGMICASIISCVLNVPLIDINGFLSGAEPSGGERLKFFNSKKTNKILVVDDTVWMGNAINKIKNDLKNHTEYKFIYLCVYLEGPAINNVDIFLEDVRNYSNNYTEPILHEWNIFQHHEHLMRRWMFDIDGVFCIDPPDDRNEKEYLNYIKNATPLFIPRSRIGCIVTYRISKNQEITKEWFEKVGIKYDQLIMFNADSRIIRDTSGISPGQFKGNIYKNAQHNLFIESDDDQAKTIAQISNKQVFCVKTNKMYNE